MSEVEETRTITKLRQNHCDDRVQGLGWGKLSENNFIEQPYVLAGGDCLEGGGVREAGRRDWQFGKEVTGSSNQDLGEVILVRLGRGAPDAH